MGRLIVLSGPSCAGKGPLVKALRTFCPQVADGLQPVVLYNDRAPRPGERDGVDYHFRPRQEIERLRERDGFRVFEVRGDLQALDGNELSELLERGDAFFEGNPFVGAELLKVRPADTVSAFLAPLSKEEIIALKTADPPVDLPALVADVMRRKLLRRTQRQKAILSLQDLENVERRAASAYREMAMAHRFGGVIVNHDGEDSENWNAFCHPLADARTALQAFAELLETGSTDHLEHWQPGLLP